MPYESDFDHSSDHLNANLMIRLLMPGKEVGVIIGKKGEIIKRFRDVTGAKINISDNFSSERVVAIIGSPKAIHDAFFLICEKIEEAISTHSSKSGMSTPPTTIRLIVPASQCGSLIGKGGSNIRRIRDESGANIQVASEMLPNSTERAVTISGNCDTVTQCVYLVCKVLLETPPKGTTIPYRPKSSGGPAGYAGGPGGPGDVGGPGPNYMPSGYGSMMGPDNYDHPMPGPMGGMCGMGGMGGGFGGGGGGAPFSNPSSVVSALAALASSQLRAPNDRYSGGGGGGGGGGGRDRDRDNSTSQDVSVPNDIIGCIIGKGGTKIAEIRQMTGAMITITKFDENHEDGIGQERVITIRGSGDQVALAQYLINTSVELHKANMAGDSGDSDAMQSHSDHEAAAAAAENGGLNPSTIPLANLLKNPAALNALTALTGASVGSLHGVQELLAHVMGGGGGAVGGGGMGRKPYASRMRHMPGGTSPPHDGKRHKFQPY